MKNALLHSPANRRYGRRAKPDATTDISNSPIWIFDEKPHLQAPHEYGLPAPGTQQARLANRRPCPPPESVAPILCRTNAQFPNDMHAIYAQIRPGPR